MTELPKSLKLASVPCMLEMFKKPFPRPHAPSCRKNSFVYGASLGGLASFFAGESVAEEEEDEEKKGEKSLIGIIKRGVLARQGGYSMLG